MMGLDSPRKAGSVTPRQRQAYDLRHSTTPPMPWAEMASRLGLASPQQAVKLYYRAKKNVFREAAESPAAPGVVDEVDSTPSFWRSKDARQLQALAEAHGLPREVFRSLEKEWLSKHLGTRLDARKASTKDLLRLVEGTAKHVLESITEEDVAKAGLRDKVASVNVLIEKRQLLSGEPTQIYSVEDRRKIDELIGAVMQEAGRRGMRVSREGPSPEVIEAELVEGG